MRLSVELQNIFSSNLIKIFVISLAISFPFIYNFLGVKKGVMLKLVFFTDDKKGTKKIVQRKVSPK